MARPNVESRKISIMLHKKQMQWVEALMDMGLLGDTAADVVRTLFVRGLEAELDKPQYNQIVCKDVARFFAQNVTAAEPNREDTPE